MSRNDEPETDGGGGVGRRNFLVGSAALAGGMAVGAGPSVFSGEGRAAQEGPTESGAPYEKLDPEAVKPLARKNYGAGMHCGEGTFHTIVNQLRDKVGEPYSNIPTTIMWPSAGGGGLQGGTCGALVGGMGAIGLVQGRSAQTLKIVDELFQWYEETQLPKYEPPETAEGMTKSLPSVEPSSPICHVSVSRWCDAADLPSSAAERGERCGRLTSDTTAKVVELLNAAVDDELDTEFEKVDPDPSVSSEHGCRTCHASGQPKSLGGTTMGKMPCQPCHGQKHGWLKPSER